MDCVQRHGVCLGNLPALYMAPRLGTTSIRFHDSKIFPRNKLNSLEFRNKCLLMYVRPRNYANFPTLDARIEFHVNVFASYFRLTWEIPELINAKHMCETDMSTCTVLNSGSFFIVCLHVGWCEDCLCNVESYNWNLDGIQSSLRRFLLRFLKVETMKIFQGWTLG